MDSYRVTVRKSVEKDLRKLDRKEIPRIVASFDQLALDPFPPSSKKLVGAENIYRLRLGDYRVIYMVSHSEKEISIERVRHRKDVYE